jgi:hypothetical protein
MDTRVEAVNRIEVPEFTPCGQCNGGRVLRNGKTEYCDCWLIWWAAVRASLGAREQGDAMKGWLV